jgi:hypothetical protein
MHAVAQNRFGFAPFGRVLDEIGKLGLHDQNPLKRRPGLNIPAGSKASLRRR